MNNKKVRPPILFLDNNVDQPLYVHIRKVIYKKRTPAENGQKAISSSYVDEFNISGSFHYSIRNCVEYENDFQSNENHLETPGASLGSSKYRYARTALP